MLVVGVANGFKTLVAERPAAGVQVVVAMLFVIVLLKVMLQPSKVPASTPTSSPTSKFQVPFAVHPFSPPKVLPPSVINVPVKGAVDTEISLVAVGAKQVPVKLSPDPPISSNSLILWPDGQIK